MTKEVNGQARARYLRDASRAPHGVKASQVQASRAVDRHCLARRVELHSVRVAAVDIEKTWRRRKTTKAARRRSLVLRSSARISELYLDSFSSLGRIVAHNTHSYQVQAQEVQAGVQKELPGGEDWQAVCGGQPYVQDCMDLRGTVHRLRHLRQKVPL